MEEKVFIVKMGVEGYTVVEGKLPEGTLEKVAEEGEVATYECPEDLLNAVLQYVGQPQ